MPSSCQGCRWSKRPKILSTLVERQLVLLAVATLLFVAGVLAQANKKPATIRLPAEQADIWVIAGQSNAGGYGLLKAPTEPDRRVLHFNRNNEWEVAEEPL